MFKQLLSTSVFKNGSYRLLYNWKGSSSQSSYWSTSSREFGCMLQIIPLLIVPFAGIVQSCRYLATGPPDLFDVSSVLLNDYISGILREIRDSTISGSLKFYIVILNIQY